MYSRAGCAQHKSRGCCSRLVFVDLHMSQDAEEGIWICTEGHEQGSGKTA